jgi:hypothetical protein
VHTFSKEDPNGGFSFAWKRDAGFAKSKMVEVSVSFCSYKDQFCRKIGTYNALANFFNGYTILVPAGSVDSDSVVRTLRNMFGLSYSWA